MIKNIFALICFSLLCGACYSQSVIFPSTQPSTYGGDEVRARDGTGCRQGTYAAPTFDSGVGVFPGQNTYNSITGQPLSQKNNIGVYGRIIIPLGKSPDRVDCNQLYNLEVERLRLELQRLKESGSASITIN